MAARSTITLAGALASLLVTGAPLRAQSAHVAVGGTVAFGMQYAQPYPQRPSPYPGNPGWDRNDRSNYAYSTGYRDGFDQGRDDARDRNRYDPQRHRRYRNGDHGYRRDSYMSRWQYGGAYRRGFLSGYDAGYRDARRGDRYDPRYPYRDDSRRPGGRFRFFWRF